MFNSFSTTNSFEMWFNSSFEVIFNMTESNEKWAWAKCFVEFTMCLTLRCAFDRFCKQSSSVEPGALFEINKLLIFVINSN